MNIPFELIFIVLFFVLPALGSLQRRLRERNPNPDAQAPPPERRPTPEPPQPTLTRADTSSPSEGWLEEAQRRVREARQEEARGRGGVNPRTLPQTPVTKPAPHARTPQPARQSRATSLEGRTLEGRSLETIRSEVSRPESRSRSASIDTGSDVSLKTAPPLRVQRLQGGGRATIGPRALRFDEPTLMTGMVWHQVLSPPLSKRRSRLSQRQR